MNTIIVSVRMAIAIIVAAAAAIVVLEIGIINVTQAQVSPGQNPMCDPNDTFVNSTESKICGVPKTPSTPEPPTTTTEPPNPSLPGLP